MAKKIYNGPEEYKPLSPWAYFGYSILFAIPIIGVIVNIVLCFSSSNINRRNYARSFWCVYVLALIVIVVSFALISANGGITEATDILRNSI